MDGIIRKKNTFPRQTEKATPRKEKELPEKKELPAVPLKKKRRFFRSLFEVVGLAFLFILISYGLYFGWKITAVNRKIQIENPAAQNGTGSQPSIIDNIRQAVAPLISDNRTKLAGEESQRINILLLGASGGKNPGKNLTDTLMMMSLDTERKKMSLLSLPRDLFVNIPDTRVYMKINSVYQYGLNNNLGTEPIRKTVEKITGQEINYFLLVDFDGFIKVIDDLGGINIDVERDIYDERYPGPNYSYEVFELKKGFQKLDGATALKYVRERHDDPEGDFGRAKRQQQVLQSVKNRAFSLGTFLNPLKLNDLLTNLEENVRTNIGFQEIQSFLALSRQIDTENINNVVVDAWKKESLLKVSHVYSGPVRAFILVPRVGNFSEVQDVAKNIFDQEKIAKRREEIGKEAARIAIINRSSDHRLGLEIKKTITEKLGMEDAVLIAEKKSDLEEKTRVIDYSNGGKIFTLDELITKLPAELAAGEENGVDLEEENDLVVIIGNDLVEPYSYEENSIEELNTNENINEYLEIIK